MGSLILGNFQILLIQRGPVDGKVASQLALSDGLRCIIYIYIYIYVFFFNINVANQVYRPSYS